jgi:hypothetical protein
MNNHLPRFGRGGHGIKGDFPMVGKIRSSGFFLVGEFNGHDFTRFGGSPDDDRFLALQHHVVGEQRAGCQLGKTTQTTQRDKQQSSNSLHSNAPILCTNKPQSSAAW